MKKIKCFDDSKVEKVPFEIESLLQENAELFFEKVIKYNLNDKTIYSDESIGFIDTFIRERARKESGDFRNLFVILIGAYLGQYVITRFKGNWVYDKGSLNDLSLDCFVRYSQDYDLYFKPFGCAFNRIELCKNQSIMVEIEIIKNNEREAKKVIKRLQKYFKKISSNSIPAI